MATGLWRNRTHSYFDYLQNTLGVDDPGVLKMARRTNMDYRGGGTDVMSISEALATGPLGSDPYAAWKDAMDEGDYQEYVNKDGDAYSVKHPFTHHFPDGNATIANADSAPGADAKTAMMMAHRAVNELG